jgi:ADP-heptose:LPS heptosyltransferase
MSSDLKEFEPERILVIQLRQIGDVLLTTPALRSLRQRYPGAYIAYLVEPVPAQVLRGNPHINEIITRPLNGGWREPLETLSRVRRGQFDLVIDYLANPRTSLVSWLSGARVSISYANRRRSFAYTHPVHPEGDFSAAHKLSLLRVLECPQDSLELEMDVPAAALEKARNFLEDHGLTQGRPIVCIEPFHKRPVREWPGEYFADLADMIKRELGVCVIMLWGPGREADVRKIMESCSHDHILAPATNLYELAAFFRMADLFVGNDGGPRHIAASQGTPTFVVLGPTDDTWTPAGDIHTTVSKDIPCRPCNLRHCPEGHHACMRELRPEDVLPRLEEFWEFLQKRKQDN